jgi:Holliday junction resolvase-like predicted endonuclease
MPYDQMVEMANRTGDRMAADAKGFVHFMTSAPPPHPPTPGPSANPCLCPAPPTQNNNADKNQNNSQSSNTSAKADQLKANATQGKAAEKAVEGSLKAEGREVVGTQVGVKTGQGLRRVDIVTKDAAGNLTNVEVKSGDAVRNATQAAKDAEIETQGGTYVGKNAPEGIRGQTLKVPTEVKKPD